jgi:phage terminase small subunit
MARQLTAKQQAFAAAYCGDATEAAIKAGYQKKTAYSAGHRLLKNPEIAKIIREREQRKINPLVASRVDRQAFWTKVMNDEGEPMRERLKASELLGRSEGDFLDKVAVSGSVEVRHDPEITALTQDPEARKLLADLFARKASGSVERTGKN